MSGFKAPGHGGWRAAKAADRAAALHEQAERAAERAEQSAQTRERAQEIQRAERDAESIEQRVSRLRATRVSLYDLKRDAETYLANEDDDMLEELTDVLDTAFDAINRRDDEQARGAIERLRGLSSIDPAILDDMERTTR